MTTLLRQLMVVVVIAAFVFAMPLVSYGSPIVYYAAGADAASIQAIVDNFRTQHWRNAPGPLATRFRPINWDGGVTATTLPQRRSQVSETLAARSSPQEERGLCKLPQTDLGTTFNNKPTSQHFSRRSAATTLQPDW